MVFGWPCCPSRRTGGGGGMQDYRKMSFVALLVVVVLMMTPSVVEAARLAGQTVSKAKAMSSRGRSSSRQRGMMDTRAASPERHLARGWDLEEPENVEEEEEEELEADVAEEMEEEGAGDDDDFGDDDNADMADDDRTLDGEDQEEVMMRAEGRFMEEDGGRMNARDDDVGLEEGEDQEDQNEEAEWGVNLERNQFQGVLAGVETERGDDDSPMDDDAGGGGGGGGDDDDDDDDARNTVLEEDRDEFDEEAGASRQYQRPQMGNRMVGAGGYGNRDGGYLAQPVMPFMHAYEDRHTHGVSERPPHHVVVPIHPMDRHSQRTSSSPGKYAPWAPRHEDASPPKRDLDTFKKQFEQLRARAVQNYQDRMKYNGDVFAGGAGGGGSRGGSSPGRVSRGSPLTPNQWPEIAEARLRQQGQSVAAERKVAQDRIRKRMQMDHEMRGVSSTSSTLPSSSRRTGSSSEKRQPLFPNPRKFRSTAKAVPGLSARSIVGKQHRRPDKEVFADAAMSFVTLLRNNTFPPHQRHVPLDQDKKKALGDFLDLMAVALPPENGLHPLVDDLKSELSTVSQSKVHLDRVLQRHPLGLSQWSDSCSTVGGITHSASRSTRGFLSRWFSTSSETATQCGLWYLLHILSVGIVEHRGGRLFWDLHHDDEAHEENEPEHDAGDDEMEDVHRVRIFSTEEASRVMRQFLVHFSSCDECAAQFAADYDSCWYERCERLTSDKEYDDYEQAAELPLWLWDVHNGINVQAALGKRDYSDVPPSVILEAHWPSMHECLDCYTQAEGGGGGAWHKGAVYHQLYRTYWSTDAAEEEATKAQYRRVRRSKFFFWLLLVGGVVGLVVARRRYKIRRTGFSKKHDDARKNG